MNGLIEFLALAGLLATLVALARASWRAIWWRARFQATIARTMPGTRLALPEAAGELPLGKVARTAVNVRAPAAPRELGGFELH